LSTSRWRRKRGCHLRPHELTIAELERLTRRFTTEISLIVGPDRDIPAPDSAPVAGDGMDHGHALNACGFSVPASVTGKTAGDRWFGSRFTGPGRGITMITVSRCATRAWIRPGARVAIQGFGKVGGVCAELMSAEGMTVVAVSDSTCGLYHADGIDPDCTAPPQEEGGHFTDYGGAEQIDREQLLSPTSTCSSPPPWRLRSVSETPTRPRQGHRRGCERAADHEADEMLEARGVLILPDILANAGGVVVSYFEWCRHPGVLLGLGEVNSRLREVMTRATSRCAPRHSHTTSRSATPRSASR